MVAAAHRVRRQAWRVSAGCEREALDARKRLRELLDADLPGVLETAFERAAPAEALLCISKLELRLSVASLEALPAALSAVLARELAVRAAAPLVAASEYRIDVLLNYLATGVLPWHAAHEDAGTIAAKLQVTLLSSLEQVLARTPVAGATPVRALEHYFRLLELLPPRRRSEIALRIGGVTVSAAAQALAGTGTDPPKAHEAMLRAAAALAAARSFHSVADKAVATTESMGDDVQALMASHAGLVLLHPFLAALLQAVGLYAPAEGLCPRLARAAALLHWLATGRDEMHEFELAFIKVLLGLHTESPLPVSSGLLEPRDREEGAALLRAVLGYWKALKGTSMEGLRVSFLERRGVLRNTPAGWRLQLEAEPFDMLLERLPWSYATVKLPWMTRPLFTDWQRH